MSYFKDVDTYVVIAKSSELLDRGEYEKAIQSINDAHAISPPMEGLESSAPMMLAKAYRGLGDIDRALIEIKKAYDLDRKTRSEKYFGFAVFILEEFIYLLEIKGNHDDEELFLLRRELSEINAALEINKNKSIISKFKNFLFSNK